MPNDPFDPEGRPYRYFSDGTSYVLSSNGPDLDADYDVSGYRANQTDFRSFSYLQENGLSSSGDIFATEP